MKDSPLDDVFIYLIERTERQTKKFANAALKAEGIEITPEQWVLLKRISEREIINQRELAELSFKDPASVTRTLDLLEKNGLVRREDMAGDRRAYNLFLSDAGTDLVKRITPIAQLVRAHGLRGISEDELAQFKRTLNKIYENYT
jgi:MarR family transcriptional regulator, organic hydroperoxide resistance regulator